MAKVNSRKRKRVLRPTRDVVIVVAHGLSEVAIAQSLGAALRMKIIVVAEDSGRSSIQAEGLAKRLLKVPSLKTWTTCAETYSVDDPRQVHIFTLMDVDDIRHSDVKQAYMQGRVPGLSRRWYNERVTPIYCDGNLEAVLKAIGMAYANSRGEKHDLYLKIFPVTRTPEAQRSKRDDFIEFRDKLQSVAISNMDVFVSTCLTIAAQQ